MKNHYVYLLQEINGSMNYIGCRSCNCPVSNDTGYWGSSKHTPNDIQFTHRKIILKRCNSRKQALEYEIEMHSKFNVGKNVQFWNKSKQTSVGFDTTGISYEEHPKGMKGKRHSSHVRKRLSDAAKGNKYSSGFKHSDETKAVWSKQRKGLLIGNKNPAFKHSTAVKWLHKDGTEFIGTAVELRMKYNLGQSGNLTQVIRGKLKSAYGWYIPTQQCAIRN